jgi:hypothetical protein
LRATLLPLIGDAIDDGLVAELRTKGAPEAASALR